MSKHAIENQQAENQQAESQQAESQQAENQQAENQQAENQQAENQQAENQQAENQQAENQQAENQQAENQQAENQQAENQQAENQQAENQQAENQQAETQPAHTAAFEGIEGQAEQGNPHTLVACSIEFFGRVQGVGFRYLCATLAKQYNIVGHVRNRRDGAVEAFCQGLQGDMDNFLSKIYEGNGYSRIEHITIEPQLIEKCNNFSVRY